MPNATPVLDAEPETAVHDRITVLNDRIDALAAEVYVLASSGCDLLKVVQNQSDLIGILMDVVFP